MKVALITGANKGIGFETAKQLAQAGCFVFLACRNISLGEKAVEELNQLGILNVEFIPLDVTDYKTIKVAKDIVEQKFNRLDILINNAGILGATPQDAINFPTTEIRKIFDTNFFGLIEVTQEFIPLLLKTEAGRIINISSPLASLTLHNNPNWVFYDIKPSGYTPSKVAMNAYTVMLAHSLKETSIKVNAINPGYTATDFNNNSGTNTADHAAKVVVKYALMKEDSPTGKYFDEHAEMPW
jgi:NAD(P)-dependent dehydrogenase (short-subunit alcohol dehydrogenase family)